MMPASPSILLLKEHECVELEGKHDALAVLLSCDDYDSDDCTRLLGIDWANRGRTKVCASYYIGSKWIKEGESVVTVRPKIDNLDVTGMFMKCFSSGDGAVRKALSSIYSIDFTGRPIACEGVADELTPMLVAHFVLLLDALIGRGVMRNYTYVTENLKSKIKGKILIAPTVNRNYASGRTDRTYCRYMELSTDCVENRILNTALEFCRRFLLRHNHRGSFRAVIERAARCKAALVGVGFVDPDMAFGRIKVTPMYSYYGDVLEVARCIFRRFGNDLSGAGRNKALSVPPYHIDMPLLYEIYVYSLLKEAYGEKIKYHVSTYGNELDFVKTDERLIIDTKYIPGWADRTMHDNVRQLSGYARHRVLRKRILSTDDDESTVLDCVIVYPSKTGMRHFQGDCALLATANRIKEYVRFHYFGIKLPVREPDC